MEKTLTEQIEEILTVQSALHPTVRRIIKSELINAFKAYTDTVIGEPEKISNYAGLAAAFGGTETIKRFEVAKRDHNIKNELKDEQRKRAEENL